MTQFPVNKRKLRYPGIPALLLFWSLVGSVAYSRNYLQNPGVGFARIASDLSVALFCFWPWAFLGPLVFQLEKRFPLGPLGPMGKNRWLRNAGILLLAGLGICYLAYLMTALLYLVHALLFSLPKGDPWRIWQAAAPEMFFQVFLYVITVQAAVVFRNWMRLEDQERERAAVKQFTAEKFLETCNLTANRRLLDPVWHIPNRGQNSAVTRHIIEELEMVNVHDRVIRCSAANLSIHAAASFDAS